MADHSEVSLTSEQVRERLAEYTKKEKPVCNVFMQDKITVCGGECAEIVLIGDASPPAILPLCTSHNKRLEQGTEAFLVKELDGHRTFAVQYNWKAPEPTP